jgi:hypothetical protein
MARTGLHRFYNKITEASYCWYKKSRGKKWHLDKTDGSRLLAETLATEIETVFADETSLVSTEAAVNVKVLSQSECGQNPTNENHEIQPLQEEYPKINPYSPLTATLSVLSRSGEPNSVVCHFVWWVLRVLETKAVSHKRQKGGALAPSMYDIYLAREACVSAAFFDNELLQDLVAYVNT